MLGNRADSRHFVPVTAQRLGLAWTYTSPAQVFAEMKHGMASLDNITWDRLEAESVVTYPSLSADDPGQAIVFSDRFPTETGRARMVPAAVVPPAELPDKDYPFVLTTGRMLEHWHTGSMTRRASNLDALEPEAIAGLNPREMERLGFKPGDMVRVTTRRGTVELAARQDDAIPDGVVFIPFAYVEAAANLLTNPKLDPFGKIPEFKFCAAKVEAVDPMTRVAAE